MKIEIVTAMAYCTLGLALAGCSSSSTPTNPGGNGASDAGGEAGPSGNSAATICDNAPATDHTCTEQVSTSAAAVESFKMNCASILKGTLVASCPSGRVGGCKRTDGPETTTTWYYPPETAAKAMGNCGKSATYVAP